MQANNKQKGAVLISALFITALSVIIATALILSQRLLIHRAALVMGSDSMYLALQGVQDWAENVILQHSDLQQTKSFHLQLNGIQLTGKIYAEQGLFNINALASSRHFSHFVRLLRAVMPTISTQRANIIANNINQWLVPSNSDNYYLHLKPSRRAGHHLMVNISELRDVRDITPAIFTALKPYITALPNQHYKIDINYAPVPVLMSLNKHITRTKAEALRACRQKNDFFKTIANYIQFCNVTLLKNSKNVTTVNHYYLVKSKASYNAQRLTLTSLMSFYQDKDGNKENVKIIWQEMNSN